MTWCNLFVEYASIYTGGNLSIKSTQGLDAVHMSVREKDFNLLFVLLHFGAGKIFHVYFELDKTDQNTSPHTNPIKSYIIKREIITKPIFIIRYSYMIHTAVLTVPYLHVLQLHLKKKLLTLFFIHTLSPYSQTPTQRTRRASHLYCGF